MQVRQSLLLLKEVFSFYGPPFFVVNRVFPLPLYIIDQVPPLPSKKPSHVFFNDGHHLFSINAAQPSDMGGDDHILHFPKPMFLWQRFSGEGVEGRTSNGPTFQSFDQCLLVNQLAPS